MVRVMIERRVAEGMVEAYQRSVREMRHEALRHEGYISGETLREVADPRHYVIISTWSDPVAWERWAASEARQRVMRRIAPLLEEPEKVTVFEPV